jgi:hypothetical protein
MHLVEVDRFDAQAAERRVQSAVEVRAGCPGIVHVRTGSKPGLGRYNKAARFLGAACPPSTDKLFRRAAAIDVSGVDHVAACIQKGVEDWVCTLVEDGCWVFCANATPLTTSQKYLKFQHQPMCVN